jgi:hypothetical protein
MSFMFLLLLPHPATCQQYFLTDTSALCGPRNWPYAQRVLFLMVSRRFHDHLVPPRLLATIPAKADVAFFGNIVVCQPATLKAAKIACLKIPG